MAPRVAVLAGRGKTGRAVAAALESRGAVAVPVGRWHGTEDLAGALVGCTAAYLVAPNLHPDERGYTAAAVVAARDAGVPRVVLHSVASPYAPAMPHHLGKAEAEDVVRRSGPDWTILQPCAYVQNLLPGLSGAEPEIRVPYAVDRPFGMVDLVDVAEAAATVLLAGAAEHAGATYELGGPRLVTVAEVAEAAGAVLDRPVPAYRIDPGEWQRSASGLDERETGWLRAMFGYYDAHGFPAGSAALAQVLGRPATPLSATLRRELGRAAE